MNNQLIVDKTTVRRFLLETQLLWNSPEHTTSDSNIVLSVIRKLECIQLDPVAAVERNHHLVLQARHKNYESTFLENLLSTQNLFEYVANAACIIPIENFAIFKPLRDYYRLHIHNSIESLEPIMGEILNRLLLEGPLPSRAFKSKNIVKGYWDNEKPRTKETTLALNILFDMGEITVSNRIASEKYYTLTEKHIPEEHIKESNEIDNQDARDALIQKYMRAYRVFDFEDNRFGWHKTTAKERILIRDSLIRKEEIIPLKIDGVKRNYYILSHDQEHLERIRSRPIYVANSIKFLPPLDNLLWRRSRVVDLFDFNYKWEIYFPESKREFGYYAMPILYGDKLIGRIDPKFIRESKTLLIKLLQIEKYIQIDDNLLREILIELENFAKFHKAENIIIEKTEPNYLIQSLKF